MLTSKLSDKIKPLPDEFKDKIFNSKITNQEIISQLLKDQLINQEEFNYLKGDIDNLTDEIKEKIDLDKLANIQSTLFNANMIQTLERINEAFSQMNLSLNKIYDFLPL
jgi:transcriptional regulator CtsR